MNTHYILWLLLIVNSAVDGEVDESEWHTTFQIRDSDEVSLNRLRAEWGVNFRYQGMVTHNIDRVWVVTKVPIPRQDDLNLKNFEMDSECNFIKPEKYTVNTREWKQTMRNICTSMKPMFELLIRKEKHHQERIDFFFDKELYGILPELKPPAQTRVGREKRGFGVIASVVGAMVTMGIEHLNSHLQHKRELAMKKAIEALEKDRQLMSNTVKQVEKDFLMYGRYQVDSLEKVIETVNSLHKRTSLLEKYFGMQAKDWEVSYPSTASGADVFGVHMSQYMMMMKEEHDDIYKEFHRNGQALLRALEKLSKGYLPSELFPPSRLKEIAESVSEMVQQSHPEYVLALDHLAQYYDMKLVTYGADTHDHSLVIAFPVFIRHHTTRKMTLFEIESIPVPIPDLNREADSYSKVSVVKPYLAINNEFYIQLRMEEMRMCRRIRYDYFCEELFLVKHMATPSCESALFYNQEPQVVVEACKFEYFYNKTTVPSVLDGGNQILLANMVQEKTLRCKHNAYLDTPFPSYEYFVVNRSILCECEVDASLAYVLRTVGACDTQKGELTMKATLNFAFYEMFKKFWNTTQKVDMQEKLENPPFPLKLEDPTDEPGNILDPPKDLRELLDYMTHRRNLSEKLWSESENRIVEKMRNMNTEGDKMHWMSNYAVKVLILVLITGVVVGISFGLWVLCKNHRIGTMMTAMAMSTLNGAEAVNPAESESPPQYICSFNWLSYIVIPLTLAGLILCLYRQCRKLSWWRGIKFDRTTDIFLFISKGCYYIPIKLLTTTTGIHLIHASGQVNPGGIELHKNLIWDVLKIDWSNFHVGHPAGVIKLPPQVVMRLGVKIRVRRMMKARAKVLISVMAKQGGTWYNIVSQRELGTITQEVLHVPGEEDFPEVM